MLNFELDTTVCEKAPDLLRVLEGLREGQRLQAEFDAENYVGLPDAVGHRRHLLFHLAMTTGRLASREEAQDHDSESDPRMTQAAIADLLIHALQLAELEGLDLGSLFEDRLRELADRHGNPFRF